MIVLWNGTKDAPWGAMLFCDQSSRTTTPESVPPEPPRDRVWGSTIKVVRGLKSTFGDRWFTCDELALAADLSFDTAGSCLGVLYRSGEIQRERKRPMAGRVKERQRYAFVSR